METIPLCLDWLWFLGYDLDSEVPDHMRGGGGMGLTGLGGEDCGGCRSRNT